MNETVETTAVELEPVRGRDPIAALSDIERQASALKAKIEAAGMVTRIGSREHLGIEALTLAGTMYGISARIVWSRPLEDGKGWEARAEAYNAAGALVGSGESMCSRDEAHWSRKPDFAVRGMAQTRSLSRALRSPVGSVVALASYAVTPAEEVDTDSAPTSTTAELPEWARAASPGATAKALTTILEKIGTKEAAADARRLGQSIFARCENTVPACVLFVLDQLAIRIEAEEALGPEPESS